MDGRAAEGEGGGREGSLQASSSTADATASTSSSSISMAPLYPEGPATAFPSLSVAVGWEEGEVMADEEGGGKDGGACPSRLST